MCWSPCNIWTFSFFFYLFLSVFGLLLILTGVSQQFFGVWECSFLGTPAYCGSLCYHFVDGWMWLTVWSTWRGQRLEKCFISAGPGLFTIYEGWYQQYVFLDQLLSLSRPRDELMSCYCLYLSVWTVWAQSWWEFFSTIKHETGANCTELSTVWARWTLNIATALFKLIIDVVASPDSPL